MNELLRILLDKLNFLYMKHEFCFTDSKVSTSFGNAYLTLKKGNISIRLVKDRGQIGLDFSHIHFKQTWYSIGLFRAILNQEEDFIDILDESNVHFLTNQLDDVLHFLEDEQVIKAEKELKLAQKRRAKKIFG